ncbi:pilus assembly protein [Mesorhizobium sp. CAU 1741]|uniref:pilus assembly protein n=1 Tax=Mesorhizobium sp. CAU 1741 TaxID=3140366 RepID=UPI00325BCD48
MQAKGVLRRLTRHFRDGRGGNFGLMAAIIAPVVLLAAGYGINVTQISLTRSNLLAALDSAVTSTARDLTTGVIDEEDAPEVVKAFLMANGLRAFAEDGRLTLDSLVIDKQARTVSAVASVELDVAFALFGAANKQIITTESAALYSDRRIEIAMMLDVTGSMKGQKIRDLKTAAGNAVTQLLLANRNGNARVRIALVPYAAAVNVGSALGMRTIFEEQPNGPNLPPPNWARPASLKNNCTTERRLPDGSADFSDVGPYDERMNNDDKYYQTLVNRDDRLRSCPNAQLVPLTANEDTLQDTIQDFSADGYTGGGIAAQWGYYMLSPNWRRVIRDAGLGDGPADPDPDEVSKVAILMTDGVFNTTFVGTSTWPEGGEEALSTSNAERVCEEMKKDGIEVFTIGFALPAGEVSAARRVLEDCASDDTGAVRHFHEASTGEELDETFREIARNIETLALTR